MVRGACVAIGGGEDHPLSGDTHAARPRHDGLRPAIPPRKERIRSLSRTGRTRDSATGRGVAADLVEYLVLAVPDLDSLAELVPALNQLLDAKLVRILDAVAISRDRDGLVTVFELDSVAGTAPLAKMCTAAGTMLSERDVEVGSMTLLPASAGLLLVTEECWAAPLAVAVSRVGGHIVAGERIPASRVETSVNLLARPDADERGGEGAWMVDRAAQLEELADLHAKGLLSAEEFERQRARVLEA